MLYIPLYKKALLFLKFDQGKCLRKYIFCFRSCFQPLVSERFIYCEFSIIYSVGITWGFEEKRFDKYVKEL